MRSFITLCCFTAGLLWTASPVAAADVTFRVAVPSGTEGPVHIAGSFQGWNPGSPAHALTELPDGRWSITLDLPAGSPIQYKFTQGSWETVEKGPSGEEIPNRTLTPTGAQTVDHTVASWAGGSSSTITGDVTTFTHAPFLNGRRVWVYLPPGYHDTTDRYPVLYMHDGQNLFDDATSFAGEWGVDETCEALIAAGEIPPVIVVGIDNGGSQRINEYTPWPDDQFGGGGADAYLAALRDVLIPEIDARYRTRPDRSDRYMAGSSLGGLLSAYALHTEYLTWTRAACLSSSYWWDDGRLIQFVQQAGRPFVVERWYQDHGTAELGVDNLNAMRDVALQIGYLEDIDFKSVIGVGQGHNEAAWRARLPDALRFLLGASACFADCDNNGALNVDDIDCFVAAFLASDFEGADCDGSGALNLDDIDCFAASFVSGCP
ncbi:MAG: alpha/beta hydrolase-fold protein [Phycisphaerales bacterium]